MKRYGWFEYWARVSLMGLTLAGCGSAGSPTPIATRTVLNLTIVTVPKDVGRLEPGREVSVIAQLDPFVDGVSYDWTIAGTAGGTLNSTVGRSVIYTAGDRDGVDVITVRVTANDAVTVGDIGFEVRSPTPTPAPTPLPTATFTATPSPSPEVMTPTTAAPLPTPTPVVVIVANFNTCDKFNNLGGEMGSAYNPPNQITETYTLEAGQGCVARLDYTIETNGWAAFWLKLKRIDLTAFRTMGFWARSDSTAPAPASIKIELKRDMNGDDKNDEGAFVDFPVQLIPEGRWYSLELSRFKLSSLSQINELVFTFEGAKSGTTGVLILDGMYARE